MGVVEDHPHEGCCERSRDGLQSHPPEQRVYHHPIEQHAQQQQQQRRRPSWTGRRPRHRLGEGTQGADN